MTYDDAIGLAGSIDQSVDPGDPRLQRTVMALLSPNGTYCTWHNAFVERFGDWFFVFTAQEGYFAYNADDLFMIKQFVSVQIESMDQ
jgi:hypothetical protein